MGAGFKVELQVVICDMRTSRCVLIENAQSQIPPLAYLYSELQTQFHQAQTNCPMQRAGRYLSRKFNKKYFALSFNMLMVAIFLFLVPQRRQIQILIMTKIG